MKKFKPSNYQMDIFKKIWFEKGHILIKAVAGSGKTTTIVKAIEGIKNRSKFKIAFVAFNNHIVEELKKRLPSSITVCTLHSLGLNCIRRLNNGKKPKIDKYDLVLKKDIKEHAEKDNWFKNIDLNQEDINGYKKDFLSLIKLCKLNLSQKIKEIEEVATKYGFTEFKTIDFSRVKSILENSTKKLSLESISFDDMVFLPAIGKVPLHQYDLVFVDECQDLNRAQQKCVNLMLKETGRLIAVGDAQQAIYGFAGADSYSFEKMELIKGISILPLSVCFRCSKNIIDFTQTINPKIQVFDRNKEGSLRYGSFKELEEGDFVLCRYNAPLTSLHRELIKANKPAIIKGQDIGKDLIHLINSLSCSTLEELVRKLENRLNNQSKKLNKLGLSLEETQGDSHYQKMKEELEIIQIISRDCTSIYALNQKIGKIFTDNESGIVLSSIHKSKGLESSRVFILFDDLTPSVNAKKIWETQQENNLIYVAYTRAEDELIFINDFEKYDIPEQAMIWRSKRFEDFRKGETIA